jgi:hypothetical protein
LTPVGILRARIERRLAAQAEARYEALWNLRIAFGEAVPEPAREEPVTFDDLPPDRLGALVRDGLGPPSAAERQTRVLPHSMRCSGLSCPKSRRTKHMAQITVCSGAPNAALARQKRRR